MEGERRVLDGGPDALSDGQGVVLAVDVLAQHDELVAAQPGHGVRWAEDRRHPVGQVPEEFVTGVVAVGVVDDLEAVQVDEEHTNGAPVSGGWAEATSGDR